MSSFREAMRRVITGDDQDGRSVVIIDGGPSPRSAASTIVDLSGDFGRRWHIQREGAIPATDIAKALGEEAQSA